MLETKKIEEGVLDIKRFYLPVEFEITCPNCGNKITDCFDDQYLSYPKVNSPVRRGLYCDVCETELEYNVKVQVSVEADLGSIKEEG